MPTTTKTGAIAKTKKTKSKKTKKPTQRPIDLLMWVGRGAYTIESFTEEALRLGACKRFGGGAPQDIIIGQSRVFVGYDDGTSTKEDSNRVIFGYFTINGILIVGDAPAIVAQKGIQILDASEAATFQDRGCGTLVLGGTYFVSEEDMKALQEEASGVTGQFDIIDPRVAIQFKRFRGFRYFNGDAFLEGQSEENWFEVGEARKANAKIRKTLQSDIVRPTLPYWDRKTRPSYWTTVQERINDLLPTGINIKKLIGELVETNPPFSTDPWRVYRNLLTRAVRDGLITIEKDGKGKDKLVLVYPV